jgi:NDP-sugar pyrophosphorylase family protein
MSGVGKRFVDSGYKELKPLIEVNGQPMIYWVMSMYKEIEDPLFIISRIHPQKMDLRNYLSENWKNCIIVEIDEHKRGPNYAIWLARNEINLERPTIVNYCDFYGHWDFKQFEANLRQNDGLILTYTGFHPHMLRYTNFAYVKKDWDGNVIDIQEKSPYTDFPMSEEASAGTYGFRTGSLLIESISSQIGMNLSTNNEFYTSITYKLMIEKNMKIKTQKMAKFFQWGTPEDLKDWNYWNKNIEYLKKQRPKIQKPEISGSALILGAGLGKRVSNISKVAKPFLEINKTQLWEFSRNAASKLLGITAVVSREDIGQRFEMNPQYLKLISKKTRGQAETALMGIDFFIQDFSKNEPLSVLACDNVISPDSFSNLQDFPKADLIVWTCKEYPPAILAPDQFSWIETLESKVVSCSFKSLNEDYLDPRCVIGNFTFASTKIAKDLINELFDMNLILNDEFYLDSIINIALNKGMSVNFFDQEYFFSIGTEDEYKTMLYFLE